MKKCLVYIICIFVSSFWSIMSANSTNNINQARTEEIKILYNKSMLALSEGRYEEAHDIADKLIHEYPDNYQSSFLPGLYQITLYFLNEDFRKEDFDSADIEVMKKINELKNKENKDVTDLVILAKMANGYGRGMNISYLDDIILHHSDSPWSDWAIAQKEMAIIMKKIPIDYDEFFAFGKKFISEHPNSHVLPGILAAMGNWSHFLDEESKNEAIQMCLRCLHDYPMAEVACAEARCFLRHLLGDEYKESPGWSIEKDRLITQYYLVPNELSKLKECVTEYPKIAQSIPVELPYPYEGTIIDNQPININSMKLYIVLGLSALVVIAGFVLISRKKHTPKTG
jgi:tetratricopeptide (TPR) repeat protein